MGVVIFYSTKVAKDKEIRFFLRQPFAINQLLKRKGRWNVDRNDKETGIKRTIKKTLFLFKSPLVERNKVFKRKLLEDIECAFIL